jgi:hypothetical protein
LENIKDRVDWAREAFYGSKYQKIKKNGKVDEETTQNSSHCLRVSLVSPTVKFVCLAVEGASWTAPDYWPLLVAQTIIGSWDRDKGYYFFKNNLR